MDHRQCEMMCSKGVPSLEMSLDAAENKHGTEDLKVVPHM